MVLPASTWCAPGCSLDAVDRGKRGGRDREGEFCEQCDILFMQTLALTRRDERCFLEGFLVHYLWSEMTRAVCGSSIQSRRSCSSTELVFQEWFLRIQEQCRAHHVGNGLVCHIALTYWNNTFCQLLVFCLCSNTTFTICFYSKQ